jgi:hypothetical protein
MLCYFGQTIKDSSYMAPEFLAPDTNYPAKYFWYNYLFYSLVKPESDLISCAVDVV